MFTGSELNISAPPSAQLTLVGGERRREVFIQSLELGHTAGIRAVKAMGESHSARCNQTATFNVHTHTRSNLSRVLCEGAASKRFGIGEEREAVPLTLTAAYNKVLLPHTDFLKCKQ